MPRLGTGLANITLGNFTEIRTGLIGDSFGSLVIVSDVQSVGELTDEATIVDVAAYGQKYMKKLVGSSNASAVEVVCNYDPSSATQIALQAAYGASTPILVALVMFAGDTGSAGDEAEGTYNMFPSIVASASLGNSFDETRTITFSIVPTNGLGAYLDVPTE